MGKGNVQIRNLQGNPVPTYYVETYNSWDDIERYLIDKRRAEINELINAKKSFCCKRTIAECLLPIVIDEKNIIAEQAFENDDSINTLENDLCEILSAKQIDKANEYLSSARMNQATIVCKNDLIMAVIDDNENNVAVAFIPSIDTASIENVEEKMEYVDKARNACNAAMKELHKRWKTQILRRTGSWSSQKLPNEPFRFNDDYGY